MRIIVITSYDHVIMDFQKYFSIESLTNEKHLAQVREKYGKDEYVAMEKIHGANFHFVVKNQNDEINIRCAKRTAYFENNEEFYGWTRLRDRYMNDLIRLNDLISTENPTLKCLRVYGELFGGNYPKDFLTDVQINECDKNSKPVQKGIFYSPRIEFLVFDIMLEFNNGETIILAHDDVLKYMLQMEKMRAVPIIFRGSFTEVLKYCTDNVQYKSTIPNFLGYNDEKMETNYAEGYVMKLSSKSVLQGHFAMLKIKHPHFNEMICQKKKKDHDKDRIEDFETFVEEMECYITQNRLNNVISHYGPDKPKPYLIGRLIDDVKTSYIKTLSDEPVRLKEFEKEWKNLFKILMPKCNKLIFD
jgi:Rnl2 family RNA ligase